MQTTKIKAYRRNTQGIFLNDLNIHFMITYWVFNAQTYSQKRHMNESKISPLLSVLLSFTMLRGFTMYQFSILDSIRKLMKSKGKELMLIGVLIIILGNYIQPSLSTSFNSTNVLLWLGIFTFIFGLALETNGEKKSKERIWGEKVYWDSWPIPHYRPSGMDDWAIN